MTDHSRALLNRRALLATGLAAAALPMRAETAREINWDALIPPGVPYGEIIGEGDMDVANDTWAPIFDKNAFKVNKTLNGARIKMPGFIIPIEMSTKGVTEFLLVPYVGACIHTPPPPPNQLVIVKSERPWPSDQLWDPVWVTGVMRTELQSTDLAEIAYTLTAEEMEVYVW